jgi:hypothetical protein
MSPIKRWWIGLHKCRFVLEHHNVGMATYRPVHCGKPAVRHAYHSYFCKEH